MRVAGLCKLAARFEIMAAYWSFERLGGFAGQFGTLTRIDGSFVCLRANFLDHLVSPSKSAAIER